MTKQEYFQEFKRRYWGKDLVDVAKEIDAIEDEELAEWMRFCLVDRAESTAYLGFVRYDKKRSIFTKERRDFIEKEINKLPNRDMLVYQAFIDFVDGNYDEVERKLTRCYSRDGSGIKRLGKIQDKNFDFIFLSRFKSGYPGFWDFVLNLLKNTEVDPIVLDICETVKAYYEAKELDEQINVLLDFIQKHPNTHSQDIEDLLAYAYYEAGRYDSAIAYFERVEPNQHWLFSDVDMYFFLGWCYSKVRDHLASSRCYEAAIKNYPKVRMLKNNLGYEYYLMKQYDKALPLFQECMEQLGEEKYAPNNYVRTLIAMGRSADALDFINNTKYHISKGLKERAQKSPGVSTVQQTIIETNGEESFSMSDEGVTALKNSVKGQQFSNEKLLEDELELRIKSGMPVFGRNLKMYRRKGEYGRQYIIPVGRLDLLCEDEDNNLFIIELKKDSGYDDAYQQTRAYIDWFDKNKPEDAGGVSGIICLNNPTDKLKEKVRVDDRVQLFEYAINYTEIK